MSEQKLTKRQAIFVAAYRKSRKATEAMIEAGYSAKTAGSAGRRMLLNVAVKTAIEAIDAKRVEKLNLDGDRLLLELNRIALFDPRKMFNAEGNPLGIHELDDDTASVIAGLDVVEIEEYGQRIGQIKKWKLADKLSAIEKLLKSMGLAGSEKIQHSYDLSNLTTEELLELERLTAKTSAKP